MAYTKQKKGIDFGNGSNFDATGLSEELKANPNAMIAADYTMAPNRLGPDYAKKPATTEQKRQLYQERIRANWESRSSAEGGDWEYTAPGTGKVRRFKGKGPHADMPAVTVIPAMETERDARGSGGKRKLSKIAELRRIKGSALSNRQKIRLGKGGAKAERQEARIRRKAKRRANR